MDTTTILIIVAAVLVIAVLLGLLARPARRRRTEDLKEQFGPEYEHTVQEYGDPDAAEEELAARQKRVESYRIRTLAPDEQRIFTQQWKRTQAEFVDAPDKAIADADELVQEVMQRRGYPVGDFEQQAADVSVDHPDVVTHYRTAHEIALKQGRKQATTEDLRMAMIHYRALFEDLLEIEPAERANQGDGKVGEGETTEKPQ